LTVHPLISRSEPCSTLPPSAVLLFVKVCEQLRNASVARLETLYVARRGSLPRDRDLTVGDGNIAATVCASEKGFQPTEASSGPGASSVVCNEAGFPLSQSRKRSR
jgi:hypothetical protein